MTRHHRCQLHARAVGSMSQCSEKHLLVGKRFGPFAVEPQHIAGALERVSDKTARDLRAYGMQLIFELRRHAEIAAAAAYGPEQIRFVVLAGPYRVALGGDELERHQIVERKTVLPHQPTQTAAEGEPCNSGARHDTPGNCQAVSLRLAIEFAPCDAALRAHPSLLRLDANLLHRCQVDYHAAINRGTSRHVVATSADRHFETEPLR